MGIRSSNLEQKIENAYIAISSDSRRLYAADIYKVLAKPLGAIEHFRYNTKWIEDNDSCVNQSIMKEKNVIIVFKHTESTDSQSDTTKTRYIPVRLAEIVDYSYDKDSEIHHYYFKLLNFCIIKSNIKYNENIFFFSIDEIEIESGSWKNKVESIKEFFPERFFYKIDGIVSRNGKNIKLKHDKINHSYFYKFKHGSSYTLELSIANPLKSEDTLSIQSSSSDINVVITDEYFISAPFDKLRIPITTKSLDSFYERSFLSFYIKEKDKILKEYENHIHIKKIIPFWKPIAFGSLTTLLISLTWLLKDKASNIVNIFCRLCAPDPITILCIAGIFLSSAILFALFNKK